MKTPNTLANLKYRMNLRKTLKKESIELLQITKEEIKRELERRTKK